jgi:hypothetical protein
MTANPIRCGLLGMLLANFWLWPVAAAFAGEHFVALHNSPESNLLGLGHKASLGAAEWYFRLANNKRRWQGRRVSRCQWNSVSTWFHRVLSP